MNVVMENVQHGSQNVGIVCLGHTIIMKPHEWKPHDQIVKKQLNRKKKIIFFLYQLFYSDFVPGWALMDLLERSKFCLLSELFQWP